MVWVHSRFSDLSSLTADGPDDLYVLDGYGGAATVVAASAGLGSPQGIAADGGGNIYIGGEGSIQKIVIATGLVSTLAGDDAAGPGLVDGVGTAARFHFPYGLAYGGAGILYVADARNFAIRKIVIATATVSTVVMTTGEPGEIAWDGAARLYTTTGATSLERIDVGSGVGTLLMIDGLSFVPGTSVMNTLDGSAGIAALSDGRIAAIDGNAVAILQ